MSTLPMESTFSLTDMHRALVNIGTLTVEAAEKSKEVRQDLASIAAWWADVHTQPERVAALMYAKAQEDGLAKPLKSPEEVARRAKQVSVALRSSRRSVKELVSDMDTQTSSNTFVARRLTLAQEELNGLAPDMQVIASRLVPILRQVGLASEPSDSLNAQTELTAEPELEPDALRCYLGAVRAPCWLVITLIVISIIIFI